MRDTFLTFAPPLIGDEEVAEVVDTLRSGWITTGPKVKRFELEFAAAVGAPSALALSSCTAALHVALLSMGIGRGDAVITTPMTFCSTLHVIEQVGARPILVDVDPVTLNLDPGQLRATISSLTDEQRKSVKAILPVHLYGHPCDMDALLAIAREYKLALVEDAAHALPASYKGHAIGSAGRISDVPILTCFSFYATKNLTTAEGGMLTGPAEIVSDARVWSLHGMSNDAWKRYSAEGSWYYEVVRPGFKYNMSDIQASIGLQQLRKLSAMHTRRREIVDCYNAGLAHVSEVELPPKSPHVEHAWHLYVLRLRLEKLRCSRAEFIKQLQMRNIGSSVHFIPLHLQPYYRTKYGFRPQDFPVTFAEYQRIVSLPLSPAMSVQDTDDVIEAVKDVVFRFHRPAPHLRKGPLAQHQTPAARNEAL